jgi:alpha-1,2-mannosyltransferase
MPRPAIGTRGGAVLAILLLAGAATVWCVQGVRKAERSTGNDLVGYLAASEALYGGADPYRVPDGFPYIYPLFLAAAIYPLSAVSVPAASVTWFLIQLTCLAYILRTGRLARGLPLGEFAILTAIVVAVFGDVLQSEFANGQVNLLVLALALAGVRLETRSPHLGPLLLGAAIAVKLTPALLLVYWCVKGRWQSVLAASAWAVGLTLLPWVAVGNRLWSLYAAYVEEFLLARIGSPVVAGVFFTPAGFWAWLTGAVPRGAVGLISAAAVVSGLIVWQLRLQSRGDAEDGSADGAAPYFAATLLLSPMSEIHHLTYLLPAAGVVACAVPAAGDRLLKIAAVAAVAFLWIARFDRRGPWYLFAIGLLTVAACLTLTRKRGLACP